MSLLGTALAAVAPSAAAPVTLQDSDSVLPDSIPFVHLSAGDEFTCGLTAEGEAYCWGLNPYGQLGAATENCRLPGRKNVACATSPVRVEGDLRFAVLDAGARHSCGLTPAGRAYCWGLDVEGALGGARPSRSCVHRAFLGDPNEIRAACQARPLPVQTPLRFSDIEAGRERTCALEVDEGRVLCWGVGFQGVQDVFQTGGFVAISAGGDGGCAIRADGGVRCWNHVSYRDDVVLEEVSVPAAVRTLTSGVYHDCLLAGDGTAYCWGSGAWGAVGAGTQRSHDSPDTPVAGGIRFETLSAGYHHTCGISESGRLFCWGRERMLGARAPDRCREVHGLRPCALAPTPVSHAEGFRAVTVGRSHVCGLDGGGTAYCWGSGTGGALGNGLALDADRPVRVMGPPAPWADRHLRPAFVQMSPFLALSLALVAALGLAGGLYGVVGSGRPLALWGWPRLLVLWGFALGLAMSAGALSGLAFGFGWTRWVGYVSLFAFFAFPGMAVVITWRWTRLRH